MYVCHSNILGAGDLSVIVRSCSLNLPYLRMLTYITQVPAFPGHIVFEKTFEKYKLNNS